MKNITAFSTEEEIFKILGWKYTGDWETDRPMHDLLWASGFDLDDWDIGFCCDEPLHHHRVEDDGYESDAEIEDDEFYIEDDTAPVTTEAPDVPEETTTKETPAVAGPVEGDGGSNAGGFPPVILALICAVAAFVLVGVVPVLVHKSHHKKLYQY